LVNLKSVSDHYTGTEQSYKYENQFMYWCAADFSVDKKLTPKMQAFVIFDAIYR